MGLENQSLFSVPCISSSAPGMTAELGWKGSREVASSLTPCPGRTIPIQANLEMCLYGVVLNLQEQPPPSSARHGAWEHEEHPDLPQVQPGPCSCRAKEEVV